MSAEFNELFDAHGMEVRGKPFKLDYRRYVELEREGRLIFIVARRFSVLIGYSCGHWYRDMNFNERVGHDGLWFVHPEFRGQGIGQRLKLAMHAQLAKAGAVVVYDHIRNAYNHPKLMADIGYEIWGSRWAKRLSRGGSGN